MASSVPSGTPSVAPSEVPADSELGEATPVPEPASFPPYPPYALDPAPPCVADTIFAGRDIRYKHKSSVRPPVRPAPRPARPRGPKATDIKMTRKQMRAHARCLRRHGAVLTDRLEYMSKPQRRKIIYLWREHQDMLPADTINRLRQLLDADEPFKPDQAYEYFVNLKKTKRVKQQLKVNQIKKDAKALALCSDKRFAWARNATVAFARGIQQRLSRPGKYALADGMLRLSNIIMADMCNYMRIRPPNRRCNHPKAKFIMEMSDKVAVWIDEILSESDDRMLMMDFDEDEDVLRADDDDEFADDFLNMMAGGSLLGGSLPAYMKFKGEMLEAFNILSEAMQKKGDQTLLDYEKFSQTYGEGADELKRASDFDATEYNTAIAAKLKADLAETARPDTPKNIEPYMNDMVEICSNYLAQHAEYNKDKGPAFKLLVKQMKAKGGAPLYRKEKASRTFAQAATELEQAKGLGSDHDDPNLSQEIHSALSKTVENVTPDNLKADMKETVDQCSKYLSQAAVDEIERGPAFDLLIQELEKHGGDSFTPEHQCIGSKHAAAYILKSAPGLSSVKPDPATEPKFNKELHRAVDAVTPKNLVGDMTGVVNRCAGYLSAFVRDRGGLDPKALAALAASGSLGEAGTAVSGVAGGAAAPGRTGTAGGTGVAGGAAAPGGTGVAGGAAAPGGTGTAGGTGVAGGAAAPGGTGTAGGTGVAGGAAAPGGTGTAGGTGVAGGAAAPGGTGTAGGTGVAGGAEAVVRRPGETEEVYQKRLAAAAAVGGGAADGARPGESQDEYRRRMSADEAARKAAGGGIYARRPGETDEQYNKRMATETAAKKAAEEAKRTAASTGRLPGETDDEYKRRMSAEAAARKAGQGTEGRRPGESEEQHRKRLASTAAAGASGAGADRRGTRLPGETDEEYRRRMSAEEAARKATASTARLPGETDEEHKRRMTRLPAARGAADDHDRDGALKILHTQLKAKGNESLYKQPHTEVTHAQASQWLMHPLSKVDNKVKESGDTDRLAKKFERKLSNLVAKVTPPTMNDAMQDVIIESARILSENFVSNNYKALATVNLIAGLQERGNEILVEWDGTTETAFFAAQRLKKADKLEANEPCDQVSYYLTKKIEELVRCKTMPRKVTPTMKEHIKDAANYLSEHVTKPDEQITAYVALLEEMEANGNSLLIEGNITKSYKDAAAYLRQLTSFEDEIKRTNSSMQSSIENKLKNIMFNVEPVGYTKSILDGVIKNSAGLLTSYMNLLGEKTEAIACLVEKMEEGGPNILLRHGNVRKNYEDGANTLRGKNADQLLSVKSADPVVCRKIQIKLDNLMADNTPQKFHNIIDAVIEETTRYLAVHLLSTRVIKVCKCMKNVFVQCELWCDEIFRHVARPSCTCSRHATGAGGSERDRSQACPSRIMFETRDCPARAGGTCPAPQPNYGCGHSFTYFTYPSLGSSGWHSPPQRQSPTRRSSPSLPRVSLPSSRREFSPSPVRRRDLRATRKTPQRRFSSPTQLRLEKESDNSSFHTPDSANGSNEKVKDTPYWQTPTTMFARVPRPLERSRVASGVASRQVSSSGQSLRLSTRPSTRRNSPVSRTKSGYSSTPIVLTDQMCDWHAMMISLMWNVQAWREWIQENIDRALAYDCDPTLDETDENWICFQRRVTTEALQWRQYNIFSRQLTLRLSFRYRDTLIVSPTRATNRTQTYLECQREMLEIIDMFNRWTQWLTAVVKESDSLQNNSDSSLPLHIMRWLHFKSKVQEYEDDWSKYNNHLKVCWESKYKSLISDWLPGWRQPGPVWVVSACGAVPSGAIAAGVHEKELIWVARTTHKCHVLPAALHPSKHCCIVYADGAIHQYTKYQVMCNAEASWVAWRAGAVCARAVRVARGVHVGRVHYRCGHLVGAVHAPHYRCQVVIFGRPFAFNCYELLVLEGDDD